jgi:hypothetical protein
MSPQWPVPLPGRPRIHSRTFAHRGPVTDRLLDRKDQPPAPTEQDSANGHRGARTAKKSDRFSEEFADLVCQRPPSLGNEPGRWLSRLPAELFRYYDRGVASFGHRPQSDRERRGRVYLLHTALVLLWMEWGRKGARRRLREQTQKGGPPNRPADVPRALPPRWGPDRLRVQAVVRRRVWAMGRIGEIKRGRHGASLQPRSSGSAGDGAGCGDERRGALGALPGEGRPETSGPSAKRMIESQHSIRKTGRGKDPIL